MGDTIVPGGVRGANILRWITEIPNDGLLRTTSIDCSDLLITTTPQAMADVMNHNSYDFEKPIRARFLLARLLGWGLVTAEGEQHKMQRKAVLPSFGAKNIRALYSLMWEKSMLLTDLLREQIAKAPPAAYDGEKASGKQVGCLNIGGWARYGQGFASWPDRLYLY